MPDALPESIPTAADSRSKRPTKKRALTPLSQQASNVEALFSRPDKVIQLPSNAVAKTLAPPPEIIANVQGSSAGAGSGEFHVYKASRRREYERVRLMEQESEREKKDREWEEKQAEIKKKDSGKLSKNQRRRQNKKESGGKKMGSGNMDVDSKNSLHNGAALASVEGEKDSTGGGEFKVVQEIGIVIHDED